MVPVASNSFPSWASILQTALRIKHLQSYERSGSWILLGPVLAVLLWLAMGAEGVLR